MEMNVESFMSEVAAALQQRSLQPRKRLREDELNPQEDASERDSLPVDEPSNRPPPFRAVRNDGLLASNEDDNNTEDLDEPQDHIFFCPGMS